MGLRSCAGPFLAVGGERCLCFARREALGFVYDRDGLVRGGEDAIAALACIIESNGELTVLEACTFAPWELLKNEMWSISIQMLIRNVSFFS